MGDENVKHGETATKQPRLGKLLNGGAPCDITSLPRCSATAKSTGQRCRLVAMRGKNVCWLHGGRGGAPKGNRNARKHGRFSKATKAEERRVRLLVRRLGTRLRLIERFADRYMRWAEFSTRRGFPDTSFERFLELHGIDPSIMRD